MAHLDSERKVIRIEQGKGRSDRYALLSERLLAELRAYWRAFRASWGVRSRPRLVELFESFCLKKARDIVVINPFIAEYLRLSPERYRLFLIPNPVAEQFFEKSSVAREPGLLLSVGWVDRLKAHDVLLRALALLRQRGVEARAVIAGPLLPCEYLTALQRYVNAEHLNVEFTNFLAPEQLADRLRRCVVLVQPSRHDNSSLYEGQH